MLFKELIFNSFYFGRVCWSSKNSVLTVSTLGQVQWSSKNSVLTVSTLDIV